MDSVDLLLHGFSVALEPTNLLIALIGCFLGTIIGALPGLGPVNGIAILIPVGFALGLPPGSSLILLCSVYYGCMYGGRITSILMNIPGDESAVVTTLEGYPMALQGRATSALVLSGVSSWVGSTVATIGLTIFAPFMAALAIYFGPAEYVTLYVLAFATIGGITQRHPTKTFISVLLGLMLATIGLDPVSGVARYTFGNFKLYDGIDYIVLIVGLFAITEFLLFMENPRGLEQGRIRFGSFWGSYSGVMKELNKTWGATARGSGLGFIVGVLPGAGPTLASLLAYAWEKKLNGRKGTFGKGDPSGLASPEAANNAAAGGAIVPMLTLGVPGSGATAIMLAMLISLNIAPGPLLFERQP